MEPVEAEPAKSDGVDVEGAKPGATQEESVASMVDGNAADGNAASMADKDAADGKVAGMADGKGTVAPAGGRDELEPTVLPGTRCMDSTEASSEQSSLSQEEGASPEQGGSPCQDPAPVAGPGKAVEEPDPDAKEAPCSPDEASLSAGSSEIPGPSAAAQAAEGPQAQSPSREQDPEPDFYCVKWITWKGERTPVITQSENGPCPLLAIMNILFLQWKVKLPLQKEVITSEELMAHLGDCLLSIKPQEPSEGLQLNFQQNVSDAMMVLPKLATGLDVNVRFTGVADFEYTPECIVFDLLGIPLYHGWLVDPQTLEVVQAVGKLSYNQLVEKIITCKHSPDPNLVTEGLIAEQFLESTASQLTYHGLCELTTAVREGELGVFFRNNHFSTMTKHQGHLYLLVTDQGFLKEEWVAWESLHTVDGDSCFCDTEFHLSHSPGREVPVSPPQGQQQLDQDYIMALSLQQQQGPPPLSDLELAQQLQQEDSQQPPPQPPPAPPGQARGRAGGERRHRPKPESDCTLL
ncbi:ubiquitin carboxyl-terminal hydrolase MINDY-1 isoform X1 [Alligator sinensis]|uniref:Ubiquitin carboxyl-terminal hydrolase n=1 Tax=Alligator sinensis TaxID=38654 RepID=A0A1U7SXV0_ALLSI|nr:ubiquitin carboxyl-terminal hydrolase MINDY-1 isoform X1 [Alligator sinensis]